MGKDNECAVPRFALGVQFTSVTGLPASTNIVELDAPAHVRAALRSACEGVVTAGNTAARLTKSAGGAVGGKAGNYKRDFLQTLGALKSLSWEEIPKDYRASLLGALASLPSNAHAGGLPNAPTTYGSKAAGFLASKAVGVMAGLIKLDGDYSIVIWPGENNTVAGIAGTLNYSLPVKTRK